MLLSLISAWDYSDMECEFFYSTQMLMPSDLLLWSVNVQLLVMRYVLLAGLGPKYSVLRYFGTRVPFFQYSSVLSTRTF